LLADLQCLAEFGPTDGLVAVGVRAVEPKFSPQCLPIYFARARDGLGLTLVVGLVVDDDRRLQLRGDALLK